MCFLLDFFPSQSPAHYQPYSHMRNKKLNPALNNHKKTCSRQFCVHDIYSHFSYFYTAYVARGPRENPYFLLCFSAISCAAFIMFRNITTDDILESKSHQKSHFSSCRFGATVVQVAKVFLDRLNWSSCGTEGDEGAEHHQENSGPQAPPAGKTE